MSSVLQTEIKNLKKELKQTKNALQNKEMMFEAILESSYAGYWDWRVQDNTKYLSPTFKSMFGYEDHEMENHPDSWEEIIHPEDLPIVFEKVEAHVNSKGKIPYDVTIRYYHKNGSIVYVYSKGKVVEWGKNGEPIRMIGSHIDITPIKEAKLKLQESEQRFRLTFESAAIGIALVDLKGMPFLTNKVFQNILKYTNEELCSMHFEQFTHPEDAKKDVELFKQLLNGEISNYNIEKRYIQKNGEAIWVDLFVSIARNQETNDPLYAIALAQDISTKKRASEDLKKSNEQLENFAYIASHDLQEPLRTLSSFIQLLKRDYEHTIGDNGNLYLKYMSDSTNRMSNLIKDLLQYSRIGKNPKLSIVDCNEIISQIKNDLSDTIQKQNVAFSIEKLPKINAFETEIRLLFQNLISNAIKFRKKDGDQVKIKISSKEEKKYWQFTVADNGIGIAEKNIEKVFKIFQRLNARKDYEGTGIGLAHCKRIVELHQGNIKVESTLGKGSKFIFTIMKNNKLNKIALSKNELAKN